jgi:hypothetical protein
MTGLERNSDVVIMAAYAPLLVNVKPGGMQWSSDLVGYDCSEQLRLAELLRQVMFSSCLGDHTLNSSVSGVGRQILLLGYRIVEQAVHEAGERKFYGANRSRLQLNRRRHWQSCGSYRDAEGKHRSGLLTRLLTPSASCRFRVQDGNQRRAHAACVAWLFDSGG